MDRWACQEVSCLNTRSFCYPVDAVHLRVQPQHLKTWSMAINDDDGDVETIPERLGKTLMPSRPSTKNPFRDSSQSAKHTPQINSFASSSTSLSTVTNSTPLPQGSQPFLPYPYGVYPYSTHPPIYSQNSPFLPSMTHSAFHNNPSGSENRGHRSSSIPSEGEPEVDKLGEYIAWLIRINPGKREQLVTCLEKLREEDIVFGTIDAISDDMFMEWGISTGVRLLLKSHMKKWGRAKAKGRA